jgi:hypothetical protein
LQGRDGLFGRRLLGDADDGVQDEDGQDNSRVDESGPSLLFLKKSEYERDSGAAQKNDNELIFELFEDKLPHRSRRLFGDGCCSWISKIFLLSPILRNLPFLPCFALKSSTWLFDNPEASVAPK